MATSSAKKLYLKAYNLVALAGWCCLTAFFAVQLVQCGYDTALTRERVKLALVLVQCFNFLEVLHNAVGIVPGCMARAARSRPHAHVHTLTSTRPHTRTATLTTLAQVLSRVFVVLVVYYCPGSGCAARAR